MNKLLIITTIILVAIVPVKALPDVSEDSKRIYCNGNSLSIIEQYEKEIVSGKAYPALILADIHHILQVAGINKTLMLLKELSRSADTDAERLYVQDIVNVIEELNQKDITKDINRWDIYDNIKERMPRSITSLQCTNNACFLSGKNKIRVSQYHSGFIPVKQFTQDYNTIGLCSGSFKATVPVTLRIYSNMDYVCYINGKKICVNALTDKKKLLRMFHIESEEGFTVALYYKPVENMFLKIQFYDDTNQIIHLPDTENTFYHDVQWYESYYEYENQLLTQYNNQRSGEAAFQLALFYESLQSIEALKYYKEALQSKNEFIACRFLGFLLEHENKVPGSDVVVQTVLKKNNEKYTSVLWQNYYDYIYQRKSLDPFQVNYLPLLTHLLHREKDVLIKKGVNLEPLLEQYPFSNDLSYIVAKITAYHDITKAISVLESIQEPDDKEIDLLIQWYEQNEQHESIVSIVENNNIDRYFDNYIHALIALKRYNDAKSALFKRIAQGFDSHAYALLATIADLEDSDGSMYRQKHEVIVSGIPWHSDYMKSVFDDYVNKTVFSRLAFETIHRKTFGLLYSCYALRIIDNTAYCSLYDLYYANSLSQINDYTFSKDVTITGCTIYLVSENGKIEKKEIKNIDNSFQKGIKACFDENQNTYVLVELSFMIHKKLPVIHIQQNYNLSQFDMDIIVIDPQGNPTITSVMKGNITKGENGIQHIRFYADELSTHHNRNFMVIALTPENLIEWINEQSVRFKIADYFVTDTELNGKAVEDKVAELMGKLKQYTIHPNPYTSTSFLQFVGLGKGTQLDAILYSRYMLAKNGIMSYIALGCSSSNKFTEKLNKDNGLFFDTVLLYIPLSTEKGIWFTCDGAYPSSDKININNILLVVGDEIILKSKNN
ncbi:MAG TPA: hypothetical protein PL059_06915 [Spirochaetota bacterium]|nr:hypothetical protein [Spirochaetota bacterium]HOM10232.1 hypothetical protein [Spirochaetota bacterium]HPP49175.1 hypothetical protein [Spirochaetota bacterium]